MIILCNNKAGSETFLLNLFEPVPFSFPVTKSHVPMAKFGQVKHCLVTCHVWDF